MKTLTQQRIDEIFDEAEEQADYIIALYREVFPRWDEIDEIDGYPAVSIQTNQYICNQAIDWDKEHTDSMPGGAWMCSGFTADIIGSEPIPDWKVSTHECTVNYKDLAPFG